MEVDTFTAERRAKVESAYEVLTGIVTRALEDENYDALITEVLALWTEVRKDDDPEREGIFENVLTNSLAQTSYTLPDTDERAAQVTRMALWLASFAVNDATSARLDAEGVRKEWVTMHDDKVRETHRAVDGKTASLAGTFMVGGVSMHYPGEPVGNPDLWMGCRCVLRAATNLTAAAVEEDVDEVTEEQMEADMSELDFQPVPWHGVLAPLGTMSGDRRLFDENAEVSTRDLPIPLKYMKKDKMGHEDSVVVANITNVWVQDGLILGEGVFADTEEAAEAIAMRAQDMMRGVSVDLDNTTTEFRDEDGKPVDVFDLGPDDPEPIMAVTKLRIAAATICAIPAFQEAYYDLGTWEDEFAMQDCEDCADDGPDRLEDQDEEEDDRSNGAVAVLVPADGDPIAAASSEPAHMTLAWFGEAKDLSTEDIAALLTTVSAYASQIDGPVTAAVGERTTLGDDDADVVMLDGDGIHGLRSGLMEDETVAEVMSRVEQYENWTPHVTLGYPESPANEDYEGETVTFDRIALWVGEEHTEFALGEEAVVAGAFPYGNGSEFRDYSPEQRDAMAKDGRAMPDGSFPIADEEDLRNAIQAIGRASDPKAAKKHIKKRAKALGKTDLLPEDWASVTQTFAPGTKDGPGWLTDPIPTSRIRRYWVHGKGAAKIRWGVPGDFNRCRKQLAKYIHNPAWLAGTCANMHKEALGFWPGRPLSLEGESMAPAYTEVPALTASAAPLKADWFEDPQLSGPTPLTITDDGRIFGHVAAWGTCHIGSRGKCIEVPTSASNYAYFNLGAVNTDAGLVSVGHITMETGHADLSLSATEAMAHYDNTAMVVADVKAGDDVFGIWIAGALRENVGESERRAIQAAALSGDWRSIGGSLEMVAALAVNVPGFPIPRTAVTASGDINLALVAAGMVIDEAEEVTQGDIIGDIVKAAISEYRAQERAMAHALPILRDHFKPPLAAAEDIEAVRNFFDREDTNV